MRHRELRKGIDNPQGRSNAPARNQVEPMDVSSADKSKSKSKNKGKQGHVANANANAANKGNSRPKSKNGSQPQKAPASGGNQNRPRGVCYTCGSKDHYSDKCPQKRGKGVHATAPEAEVVDEETWQAGEDQTTACIGPLHLNLSNLNL